MASPTATASLDKATYRPGDLMVLTIDHADVDRQTLTVSGEVTDSTGAKGSWSATAVIDEGTVSITASGGKTWTVQSATLNRTVFTATAQVMPTVSGTVTDRSGNVAAWSESWTVQSTTALTVIGMSSPATLWDQRLTEVTPPGVKARRIYCDLSSTGLNNLDLVDDAIAAGMTPVVSFKPANRDYTAMGAGTQNAWVTTAANQLQSRGARILVACWHEPFDDMTGPQFLAIQRQVLPILNAKSNLETYCILHGWLLDNRLSDFAAYMAPDVMALLDYFGIDSYQSGDNTNPGTKDLSTRMPTLLNWLAGQGVPSKPLVIGEFSSYTAASLTRVGDTILSTPQVKYALLFNSNTGSKGEPLVPGTDRMAAFQATKADPRAMQ